MTAIDIPPLDPDFKNQAHQTRDEDKRAQQATSDNRKALHPSRSVTDPET